MSGTNDIQNGKVVPEIIQEGHELFFCGGFYSSQVSNHVPVPGYLFFGLSVQKLALGVVDGGVDSVFVQSVGAGFHNGGGIILDLICLGDVCSTVVARVQ